MTRMIICRDCKHEVQYDKRYGLRCYPCWKENHRLLSVEWRKRNQEKYRAQHAEHSRVYRQRHLEEYRRRTRIRKKRYRENHQEWKEPHRIRSLVRRKLLREAGPGITQQEWQELCESHGNKCLCCGKPGTFQTLTIDHVVPVSRGGRNDRSNIQPLCFTCNSSKRTKTTDYRQSLSA